MSPYRFETFRETHLALVEGWLTTPEVVRWWGDPAEQFALLREDLSEPLMRQWVVEYLGHPFAYVQAYEAHSWPQLHLSHLPVGAQVIDAFIGDQNMLGCGHGSAFLALLSRRLIEEGAPIVAIDPKVENLRARRAFARAGFVEDGITQADEGAVVLMVLRRNDDAFSSEEDSKFVRSNPSRLRRC